MTRKCGQTRQASSDTTVRPTRPLSDMEKLFSATTVAAPSYEYRTLPCLLPPERRLPSPVRTSHTHCRPSATRTPIHGRLSPSWSAAGRREFRVFSDTKTCASATTTLAAQLRNSDNVSNGPSTRPQVAFALPSARIQPTRCRPHSAPLGGCHGLP